MPMTAVITHRDDHRMASREVADLLGRRPTGEEFAAARKMLAATRRRAVAAAKRREQGPTEPQPARMVVRSPLLDHLFGAHGRIRFGRGVPSHESTPASVLTAPRLRPVLLQVDPQADPMPRRQRRALARAATANPKRHDRILRRAFR